MSGLKLPEINRVVLSGRLTRDADKRYAQDGTPITCPAQKECRGEHRLDLHVLRVPHPAGDVRRQMWLQVTQHRGIDHLRIDSDVALKGVSPNLLQTEEEQKQFSKAVKAARKALHGPWGKMSNQARADMLRAIADGRLDRSNNLRLLGIRGGGRLASGAIDHDAVVALLIHQIGGQCLHGIKIHRTIGTKGRDHGGEQPAKRRHGSWVCSSVHRRAGDGHEKNLLADQGATRPPATKAACVIGINADHACSYFSATISISRCG